MNDSSPRTGIHYRYAGSQPHNAPRNLRSKAEVREKIESAPLDSTFSGRKKLPIIL